MNPTINEKLEAMRLQLEGKKLGTRSSGGALTLEAVMHAADIVGALKDLAELFNRLIGDLPDPMPVSQRLTPEQKQQVPDMLREVQRMTDEAKSFQDKLNVLSKKMRSGKFSDFMHQKER